MAKPGYGGLVLGLSQFLLMPYLSQNDAYLKRRQKRSKII